MSPLELSDKPNRARNIYDMDLDDIMNGSDDEKPEPRTLSKTPSHPKISKSARDLIEFLDQGPPTDLAPSLPPQSPVASSFKSPGRFQRMMSRLTGSSSSEKLREESVRLRKTPVANAAFNSPNGAANTPQTPVKKVPSVVVATPPPRMQPTPQQTTSSKPRAVNHDSLRPVQRKTSVRKKIPPPIDPQLETSARGLQSPPVSRAVSNDRPPPSTPTDGDERRGGISEFQPSSSPLLSLEPEPQPRTSVETTASDGDVTSQRPAPAPPAKITVEVTTPPPAPPPVTIRPPSSSQDARSLNAAHAQSLRHLMSTATTADECRVLVDMFLARVGFPVDRSTDVDPYPSPVSFNDPSDVDLESSVIETLLGGDSSTPSTAIHSAQPSEAGQADESEVGTSDAETCDEVVDSPTQRSPSRIVRDARVNRPPPPASRLLVVA